MNDILKPPIHPILEKTAINMLKEKIDPKYISSVTGFSVDDLLILKNKIYKSPKPLSSQHLDMLILSHVLLTLK